MLKHQDSGDTTEATVIGKVAVSTLTFSNSVGQRQVLNVRLWEPWWAMHGALAQRKRAPIQPQAVLACAGLCCPIVHEVHKGSTRRHEQLQCGSGEWG